MPSENSDSRYERDEGGDEPSPPPSSEDDFSFGDLKFDLEELADSLSDLTHDVEELPQTIGPYRTLDVLGEGGMGIVYLAEQREPIQRRVALKVIKLGMDTRHVIARFEAEKQALALMDHPNIAKVFDVGATATGRPYMAMELVRGVNITEYCDENRLSTPERLELCVKVCQALQHAHQKGIIHRDIKPSNILVTTSDGVAVPKVIDFGIAKAIGQKLTEKTLLTEFQTFVGTPVYMSPEQLDLSGVDIDTRSDIYALGVLLYELLTGRTPFDAKELRKSGPDGMRRIIREDEPLRPSTRLSTSPREELTTLARQRRTEVPTLIHSVRGDLDWIVMKCLDKDRDRRYETAAGLAADIGRYLTNEPIVARPPSVAYRIQKFIRRNKLVVTASTAVALALVVGLGVSIWQFLEKNAAYQQLVLSEQNEKTARAEAEAHARKAEASHREAEASVARQILQRATERFQAGDAATALSSLAHLLRRRPDHPIAAYRIVAELSSGNYSLPVAALTDDLETFLREVGRFDYAKRRSVANFVAPHYSQHFSPDSRLVVTAGEDGTVRIWDARSGTAVGEPMRHPARVLSVDFSPNSRQVVTACEDGAVRIWDAQTGQAVGSPLPNGRSVRAARFSPDGQTVATLALDRTVGLWDVRSGRLLWGFETHAFGWPIDVQFSKGGERLMASSENRIQIWDIAPRKLVTDFEWKKWGTVYARPELRPDGGCFMCFGVGGGHQTVLLKSIEPSSQPPIVIDPGGHMLRSARFSPDNRWVVTTRLHKNEVKVWHAHTGDRVYEPLMHQDIVTYAAFSSDSQRLVTCSEDGVARIFEARNGNVLSETRRHGFPVTYAEFSSDGQRLLTRAGATTWLWDIRLAQPTSLPFQHVYLERDRQNATLTADGQRLLTLLEDGRPRIWEVSTGRLLLTINGVADGHAVISPDGRRVAAAILSPFNGAVRVFDAATGQAVGLPAILSSQAAQCRFSPDGKSLVTRSVHGQVFIHSVETGEIKATLRPGGIPGLPVFSPNSRQLLTTIFSGTAQLWDADTGQPLLEPMLHEGGLAAAAFSPDGNRMATFSSDGLVHLWDARTAKPLDLPPMQHAGTVGWQPLGFSPDGMRLATAAGHGAYLWDLRTGASSVPVMVHEARVNSVRFNPEGTRLITASSDGRARLWDAATGFLLDDSFKHEGEVYYAEFTPDGTKVVTSSADRTARIWKVQPVPAAIPDWLASLAEAVAGQRTDDQGFNHPVGVAELIRLRHQLGGSPSTSSGQAGLAGWTQWFFADSATRRVAADPASIPVSAHVDRLVEIGTVRTLSEAVQLLPTHPRAAGRLAAALTQGGSDPGTSRAKRNELGEFLLPQGGLSNPKPLLLFQEFVHRDTGGVSSSARRALANNIERVAAATLPPPPTLVPKGAVWKYHDQGQDLGTEWRTLAYDDSAWPEGPGPLGYAESGTPPITTRISFGSNPTNKHITTYFRHAFPAPTNGLSLVVTLHLRADRGAIVYLNGREIARNYLPEGPVSASTLATGYIATGGYRRYEVSQHLQPGTNVLAVEVHQVNASSSDLCFDLMLRQGSLCLFYFWSFSPEQFQAEVQDFLSHVPPTLQGDWTHRFEFAYKPDPSSAPESIKGNWRNWEVRAQLQADLMTHTAEARQAYETCLELLRAQPASEAIARRIETVRRALESLPK